MSQGNVVDPSVCKAPGFYPTPGSCVNFYVCDDPYQIGAFRVFQFNCALGTIFDPQISGCNHIAWTLPHRPECADMMQFSVVPQGSAPQPGGGAPQGGYGTGGSGGYGQAGGAGGQTGVVTGGGSAYPQPGGSGPTPLFSLPCITDNKYYRHTRFCNRYYRCQEEEMNFVFKTLTCPENLLFDNASQQCTDPSMTPACDGELAPYPTATATETVEGSGSGSGAGAEGESAVDLPLDPSSQYACTEEGYFPFEQDCVRFYKCSVTTENSLIGYRYKCPEGYGYSDELKRCESEANLPPCEKAPLPASLRGSFPAIQLKVAELRWFFNY